MIIFFILGHLGQITFIMSQGMPGEGKAPLRTNLKKQNLPKRPKNLPKLHFFNYDIISAIILFICGHLGPVTIVMSQGMPGKSKAPLRTKLKKRNLPKRPKNLPK